MILQDPHDEVIAYPASLQSGIASSVLLHTPAAYVQSISPGYATAHYSSSSLDTVLPPTAAMTLLETLEATTPSAPLTEPFIMHLLAIILHISKVALDARGPPTTPNPLSPGTPDLETATYQHQNPSSSRQTRLHLSALQSSQVVALWVSLGRIDGGGGNYLSHVIHKGYDTLRAWLLNLILWHPLLLGLDTPPALVSLQQAIEDIEVKVGGYTVTDGLLTPTDLAFLLRGLKIVHHRAKQAATEASTASGERLGRVIPLRCGHNGWPEPRALAALTNSIKAAGFDL